MGGAILLIVWILSSMSGTRSGVFDRAADGSTSSSSNQNVVPWDYKVEEKTVGDLVNGDMTISPDNQLLPNDNNYATGDKVWTLSYMYANMSTDSGGRTNVSLS